MEAQEKACQVLDAKLKGDEVVAGISQATPETESDLQGDDCEDQGY